MLLCSSYRAPIQNLQFRNIYYPSFPAFTMSLMDIFKKVFAEKKEEIIEKKPVLQLSQIPYTLQELLKKKQEKLHELKKTSLDKINKFNLDLEMNIRVLETLSLEKRKEDAKLKATVFENLKRYIDYLKCLMHDLNSIHSLPPTEYLSKASKLIENFTRNSKSSYEKATILIGDELGKTRETINSFLASISQNLNESEIIKEEIKTISEIEKNMQRIEEIQKNVAEISQANEKENLQKNQTLSQIEENKKDIQCTKDSNECKNSEEEKAKAKEELNMLDNKIQEIKDKIDLKLLSKHLHTDIKKSSLINKYLDNFKEAMKNDSSLAIIDIVREAKGLDVSILRDIRKRQAELISLPQSQVDQKLSLLAKEIEKQESEVRNKVREIEENTKKAEKLKEREKEVIAEVKESLAKINISLKD